MLDIGEYVTAPAAFLTSNYNKYLLAFLQSKFTLYFVLNNSDSTGAGDVMLNIQSLKRIPIPFISQERQRPFELLVDEIIAKKERGEDTSALERKIDVMVYKLYGLSYDEVKIVDKAFWLSRAEYENATL